MTIVTIISGIILILGGVAVFFTPVETFLFVGYFLAVLFMVYGIAGIIKAFQGRSHALEIILDVLSILVGIACIMRPGARMEFDLVLLCVVATWFIFQGIFTIMIAIKTRDYSMTWILGVIVGVISVIVGIASLVDHMFGAQFLGYLIGIYFIEAGVDMLVLGISAHAIKKELERAVEAVRDEYNSFTNQ